MNKKGLRVLVLALVLLITIFSVNFAVAAEDINDSESSNNLNTAGFDKAYSCLKDAVSKKTASSFTMEELAFSLLALGYDSASQTKLKTELDLRKDASKECWPKSACNLKETALASLVYDHLGIDNEKINSWLLNQTIATSDLIWYLQIDTDGASSCKITYDGSAKTINIDADKKITGSPGSCLSLSSDGYWLEVRTSCYGKEFKISCDQSFLSSLIYKSRLVSDSTIYVSATTNNRGPNEETSESVQSFCLKQSGVCNYEGNLWAVFALNQKDSKFKDKALPYLMTLASNNARYFPSSFLYSLTNFDEYLSEMNNKQNAKGYWQLSTTFNRYYDTGLALLSLYKRSSESEPFQKALQYLLDPTIQGDEGCWNGNNIRDTALILFAASPKFASSDSTTPDVKCSSFPDYDCTSRAECEDDIGGTILDYSCPGTLRCCSDKKTEETCSSKGGVQCNQGQECSGGDMESASGTDLCCIEGTCKNAEEIYTCESAGSDYTCRTECADTETSDDYLTCAEDGICCQSSSAAVPEGKSYWWVVILLILIVLLIFAILKREQLKIWIFKMKNKFSRTPSAPNQFRPGFPPMPPRPGMPGFMPRRIIPGAPGRPPMPLQRPGMRPMPPAGKPYPRDKELAETLEKLKRISK